MSAVPSRRAGMGSAMNDATRELGAALGIAVLGSIGTVVYRSQLAGTVPAGVPPASAEAARDTLGGALAAAQALPAQLGAALQDTAREAFTQGLRLAFAVNAGLAIGIAVVVAVLLRGVPTDDDPTERPA